MASSANLLRWMTKPLPVASSTPHVGHSGSVGVAVDRHLPAAAAAAIAAAPSMAGGGTAAPRSRGAAAACAWPEEGGRQMASRTQPAITWQAPRDRIAGRSIGKDRVTIGVRVEHTECHAARGDSSDPATPCTANGSPRAARRAGRGRPASVIPEDLRRGGVRQARFRREPRENARYVREFAAFARPVDRRVARTLLYPSTGGRYRHASHDNVRACYRSAARAVERESRSDLPVRQASQLLVRRWMDGAYFGRARSFWRWLQLQPRRPGQCHAGHRYRISLRLQRPR